VADVKALYAADVIREIKPTTLDDYFDRAAEEIRRTNRLCGGLRQPRYLAKLSISLSVVHLRKISVLIRPGAT
jgi:hypothetical protein